MRLAPQPGQSLGEELAGLGAGDVVVLVGFRRRPAGFARIVAGRSPRAAFPSCSSPTPRPAGTPRASPCWLECPVDSASPFDSYAAAMSLVNLLASGVLGVDVRDGRTRIASITSVYDALDELETPGMTGDLSSVRR